MRNKLAERLGQRTTFYGTVVRFGTKRGWQGRPVVTMLLTNLRDKTDARICDHIWLNCTKDVEELEFQPGDTFQCNARLMRSGPGSSGRRARGSTPATPVYWLHRPTKIVKVTGVVSS